jgi:hypothetical protein
MECIGGVNDGEMSNLWVEDDGGFFIKGKLLENGFNDGMKNMVCLTWKMWMEKQEILV